MIDRNRALTSEDLIRRYDLESLKINRKAIQMNKQGLDKTEGMLNQFILSVLKGISNTEDQVDGKVATWFYNHVPTASNEPANNWATDADKNSHLGDLFYNKNTGYVYMYDIVSETYTWVRQSDDSVVQAMAIANSNPDTSDGYRDIFVIEPTTPYKVGDIWFKEDGSIYRCNVARASGDFNDAEWIISTKYSNDDYVNNAKAIINDFKETITTNYICKVLVKSTRDSIELSVQSITGGYSGTLASLSTALQIEAGKISQIISAVGSDGEVTAGSIILAINNDTSQAIIDADKISLAGKTINLTGDSIEINSTNFSVDDTGNIEAKSGKIGGYIITADSLYAENYAKNNYTQNDLDLLQQYIMGQVTLTDAQKEYLDANNDGVLNTLDLVIIKKIITYGVTKTNPLKIIINSGVNGIDSSYEILDGNNVSRLRLSVSGITTEKVSTDNIDAGNIDCGTCTLNSNSAVSVSFNKTFTNIPRVAITPNTTSANVIAPKIREVSATGFKAIIGGSGFSNIDCDWIAIG